jgi:predicted house-cleaning NTP pyrophosphatase (Maf/HAM1 superfamily)
MIREISGLMTNVIGLPVESLLLKLQQFTTTEKL